MLVGVGVTAEDSLAREAGLECANGVVVNAHLATSDPDISAIGDCAAFPNATLGFSTRLESIQNAVDQAKCVAARLAGKAAPYDALAWFWSDQGDLKLMIAGLSHDVDRWVVRGDLATRAFSTFGFRGGKLAVVEFGQPRRRPRGGQAHLCHGQDDDPGTGGRPGLRPPGAGEGVAGPDGATGRFRIFYRPGADLSEGCDPP